MDVEIVIAVGAILLLVATFWILTRQHHPADSMEDVGGKKDQGPTDDAYPPGSRPAGPDAESQVPEPNPRHS